MIKYIFIFSLLWIIPSFADTAYRVVLNLPWDTDNSARYDILPEGIYGPQAFDVVNDRIILLDNQNQKLRFFTDNVQINSVPIPSGCFGLKTWVNEYLIHDGHTIWEVSSFGTRRIHRAPQSNPIKKIRLIDNQAFNIQYSNGMITGLQKNNHNTFSKKSTPNLVDRALKVNSALAQIELIRYGSPLIVNFDFPGNNLASIDFLGSDAQGNLYLLAELFIHQAPLLIIREVRKYDADGHLLTILHIPSRGYAFIQNDLIIKDNGLLYHLFSNDKGLRLIRWDLASSKMNNLNYPDEYYQLEGVNQNSGDSVLNIPEVELRNILAFPQVTPEEAIATGDTYVQLGWTCTDDNITNGLITDSYGNRIETPSWVVPGNLEKVPYKWGGFQTIDQFVTGITSKKYAGDRYTGKSSGTPSAVGVDCSGFVSRCWKLPTHYSTRMMDDAIAQPYDSWEQTRPGDAAHIPGHVRLIVEHNPDGTIKMVEAAGYNWRVSYRSYNYAALGGYTPRYYINMQGTPGNIPQPRLDQVSVSNGLNIKWNINGVENIAEFKLSESEFVENWSTEYIIENTAMEYSSSVPDGCRFYKLTGVSSVVEGAEGLPSDVYGGYHLNERDKVLIIDGFDRTSVNSGSWSRNYHQFSVDYGLALFEIGIPFECTSNDAVINGSVNLDDFKAVIWFVGDESTVDETFNNQEQDIVEEYLKQGGNLFVTGSEIGWDLDYKGTSSDKTFIQKYLKCRYVEDDSKSYSVTGIAGTPFEGLTIHYDNGSHGVYEEDYPDVLGTEGGSGIALRYANKKNAAVYYDGLFEDGTTSGKLFIMGFPFETIYNASEQQILMSKIMAFFDFETTVIEDPGMSIAREFILFGNFPNPFNNQTNIHYTLPYSALLSINVYNSLGQLIFSDEWTPVAGKGYYRLSAKDLSSGIYYYRIGSNNFGFHTGKLVLVR